MSCSRVWQCSGSGTLPRGHSVALSPCTCAAAAAKCVVCNAYYAIACVPGCALTGSASLLHLKTSNGTAQFASPAMQPCKW